MNPVSEDSLVVAKHKGGRPRVASEPLVTVTICITRDHHERLCKYAHLHDLSLSAIGRKIVERAVDRVID